MKFPPMFSSRIFIIALHLALTFSSRVPVHLTFEHIERQGSNSLPCMWMSTFPVQFAGKAVLALLNGLGALAESCLTINERVYFCAFYSISLVYMSVSISVSYYSDYHSFVVSFKIRKCETSNFVLPYQDCLGYPRFLKISYEF